MTHVQEEWKPVVGFEGYYEVSDLGRIRTVVARSRFPASFVLKPQVTVHGYLTHRLTGQIKRYRPIHQVVAEAFIGTRPAGYQVNHIDGNKHNNHLNNLEYVTPSENQQHAVRTGLRSRGNGRPKLTLREVGEIRSLLGLVRQRELAQKYDVHPETISRICRGVIWREARQADRDFADDGQCVITKVTVEKVDPKKG